MVVKKNKKLRKPKVIKKKVAVVPKKYKNLSYAQLLKHPRWQRKRLKIMERDGSRCKKCRNTERQLHVHHLKYTAKLPWLELNKNLSTYCYVCHMKTHKK